MSARRTHLFLNLLLVQLATTACSWHTDGGTAHYFGYTRVVSETLDGQATATSADCVGLGFDSGVWLGYRS